MTITSANSAIEMSIRFNRALETFKYFASNWDENARQILVMQMIKGRAQGPPFRSLFDA